MTRALLVGRAHHWLKIAFAVVFSRMSFRMRCLVLHVTLPEVFDKTECYFCMGFKLGGRLVVVGFAPEPDF